MNLLLGDLPDTLEIGGETHKIHSDFRTWIQVENLLFWSEAPWEERIAAMLYLCYVDKMPNNLNDAILAAMEFYRSSGSKRYESANASEAEGKEQKSTGWQNRAYSFDHDASLIYAAFYSQYGIDLNTAQMHWWQFSSLFSGLDDSNRICKIMEYRTADLSVFKDKDQKAFYRRMKQAYRLPDPRSEEEKDAAMMDALAGMF